MAAQSFNELVQGLPIDDNGRLNELRSVKPATRRYLIFFTARSGSTWLTSQLSGTDRLGFPEEYINPDFVRDVAVALNARTQMDFLEILVRRRQSPNGIFGMEIRHIDVQLFGEDLFFNYFGPSTIIFNLWRDNIVAQGLSLYRAVETGRYHSTDPGKPPPPPEYNAEQIKSWIAHLLETENGNIEMLARNQRAARFLRYEDLMRSPAVTRSIFADALRTNLEKSQPSTAPAGTPEKIGDSWNADMEVRFRQSESSFLSAVEKARLVRRQPGEPGWIRLA